MEGKGRFDLRIYFYWVIYASVWEYSCL
jgi:hypothetical protein